MTRKLKVIQASDISLSSGGARWMQWDGEEAEKYLLRLLEAAGESGRPPSWIYMMSRARGITRGEVRAARQELVEAGMIVTGKVGGKDEWRWYLREGDDG